MLVEFELGIGCIWAVVIGVGGVVTSEELVTYSYLLLVCRCGGSKFWLIFKNFNVILPLTLEKGQEERWKLACH